MRNPVHVLAGSGGYPVRLASAYLGGRKKPWTARMSTKTATGIATVSLASVIVLIAQNGDRFIASVASAWDLAVRVVQGASIGLWAVLLSWALGCLLIAAVRHFWHEPAPRAAMHRRVLVVDALGCIVAFAVCWTQFRTGLGIALSAAVGLSIPFVYRASAAVASAVQARLKTET